MSPRIGAWVAAGLLTLLATSAGVAFPKGKGHGTPDGVPPADEEVCSNTKGGPAHGLCVAYCEANDCELTPDSPECVVLRNDFARLTGSSTLPCDDNTK
jgi:hypothetical protein